MLEYVKYLPSQENIECCTSSATLLAAETILAKHGIRVHFSRLFLYYVTRLMQGRLGQKGAELGATLRAFSSYGVCLDRTWPLRNSLVDKEPTMKAFEEARDYMLVSYEPTPIDEFNDRLEADIPIIIGFRTGKQFWKLRGPFEEQKYMPINDTDNRLSFGHAVTIVDNRPDLNAWIVANSKGLKWGNKGFGILPYDCAIDIGEAYSITGLLENGSLKNF